MMKRAKLLCIELDGASWNVINPLLEKGKLPNIQRLIESGAAGSLMSVTPLISPKIWTSIFAGKSHEKTGIDFFGAYSEMVKCKRIWDIFSESGMTVGTFGTFVTWPPYEVNGFMIPAVDSVGTETYPAKYEFFQEIVLNERRKAKGLKRGSIPLMNLFRYAYSLVTTGVGLNTSLRIMSYLVQQVLGQFNEKDKYWRKLILHSDISADIFRYMCGHFDPDFATIHMHICDSGSHRYWMAYEPDMFPEIEPGEIRRYREVIPKLYMQADKAIGKILAWTGKETSIIVVSDHGFEAVEGGIDTYDLVVDKLLEILGIKEKVIAARFGPGLYLNFQDEALMHRTADLVSSATLNRTGEKVFYVKMFEKTLIITKPVWKVDRQEGLRSDAKIAFGEIGSYKTSDLYASRSEMMSGVHKKEGVVIFSGPSVAAGVRLEGACIYDVAPTILYLMGYPVARDMDGRVLTEALEEGFVGEHPIEYTDTYEDSAVGEESSRERDYKTIQKRLKSLGYL